MVEKYIVEGEELIEKEFNSRPQSVKELTVVEIESIIDYRIKIVRG